MNIFKHIGPACLIAFTVAVSAQTCMSKSMGHDMGAMAPVAAPESLPAPLKMAGLGNSHLAIQTASPEAQMWFDQGLNELHDFWDYEAAKSFEQALRADPNCAMCAWGLTEALSFRGGRDAYTMAALEQAKKLGKHAPKPEQLFIKAADYELNNKDKKAVDTYRKLVALQPDNIQARLYLAGAVRDGYKDGEPKAGTQESIAIYTSILKDHPDDSATNHYWIHAMEPSNHPERAIESAQKLAGEAPASGHMVHMPGHIFYRTGDYASAEKWFARSTAVDETYMDAQHVTTDDDWNYVHNLQYGIANLMEEGKWKEAAELSKKLARGQGQFAATLYTFRNRDQITRLNHDLPIAMREGSWQTVADLLADVKPADKLPNLQFFAGQLRTYADGMRKLEQGDTAAAEADAKVLEDQLAAARAKLPPNKKEKDKKPTTPVMQPVMPDAAMGPLLSHLSIMALELRASVFAARKDVAKAKPMFEDAAKKEKDLGYTEPPAFIQPVDEAEGAALLKAGDPKDAHAAYAAALVERPNSGLSLYGEAQSSEAAGDHAKALDEYAKFLAAWKNADPDLPQTRHAQEFYMAHTILDGTGKKAE